MSVLPRPIRTAGQGVGRALRGAGSIVGVLAVVAVLVFLLAGRPGAPASEPSQPPIAAAAGASASPAPPVAPSDSDIRPSPPPLVVAPTPSSSPGPKPEPTQEATPASTPEATPKATPRPTAEPTPAPTKRPVTATPKPTHDPAPEPTPGLYRASGSLGDTLTAGGVTVFLARHAPSADPNCVSGESSLQGHTQVVSFTLTMTWSKPAEAMEPFVAVGAKPFFNVQWSDPQSFHSGGTYVWSTCVRPGDTGPAVVSVESNGGTPRSYRFTFG